MERELVRLVLVRLMIEHRFVTSTCSWAQALGKIAKVMDVSQRYVRDIVNGRTTNPVLVDRVEDAITVLSDHQGGVPYHCCTPESVDVVTRNLYAHYMRGK